MATTQTQDETAFSDSEAERSPFIRFRSEALKYQNTISAGENHSLHLNFLDCLLPIAVYVFVEISNNAFYT